MTAEAPLFTQALTRSLQPDFTLNALQRDRLSRSFDRYAITFGLYKNEIFQDRLFPFGVIPRLLGPWEYDTLEKGLKQRLEALNLFLADLYGARRVFKDKIIPEDFVLRGAGYLKDCDGVVPPKGIYTHIAGIDLVQENGGRWVILEDNLRVPSGASYPLIARRTYRSVTPELFDTFSVRDTRPYGQWLRETLDHVNCGGLNILLSPGRYNAAFFEHTLLAQEMGIRLAFASDLSVEKDRVWYRNIDGEKFPVGAIYRRTNDEWLDPRVFRADSQLGIPGLFEVYRKGGVALLNALGNGAADDKGVYYFVPKLIRYYLGETPILDNAPTYLAADDKERRVILERLPKLVIKDVAEAGGYGVVFGDRLSRAEIKEWRARIEAEPRRFIAQEVVDFRSLPVLQGDRVVYRKADLRAFLLYGADIRVWPGGLTRYAMDRGSRIVNSSQGGGFKDTWVLSR